MAIFEEKRKKFVIVIELDNNLGKLTLDSYVSKLSDVAEIRKALNIDDAYRLLINEFRVGVILVLGGSSENLLQLTKILEIAINQARQANFKPTAIIANTGNLHMNHELLKAGCTHSAERKKDLPSVIRNYGQSRVSRDIRSLSLR